MKVVSLCFALLGFALALPLANASAAPISAKAFTDQATISGVTLSPDGKHIAAITSPDGQMTTVSVWSTDDLGKPPTVIAADKVRILGVGFLKNDRLLIQTIQTFTAGVQRTHLSRQFVSDLQGKSWADLLPDGRRQTEFDEFLAKFGNAQLLSALPMDPRHVMVVDQRPDTAGDIVKVDIYSGATERVDRASDKFGGQQLDLKGEVRARQEVGYVDGKAYIAQWLKSPDSGKWEEHFRSFVKDRETFEVAGFTPDPNIIYVLSDKGRDKAGIYEYDIRQRKILEPLFEHKLFDASRVLQSTRPENYGEVLGFAYEGATTTRYWTDPKLAPLNKTVRAALGVKTKSIDWIDPANGEKAKFPVVDGADAEITDWSDDLKIFIVTKSGPRQPDEYYLLDAAGKLQLLGGAKPDMDLASLGDTRLVQYAARDGLVIPAFLTTPPAGFGAGPFPTLIIPHGGPWARDNLDWDIGGWTQFFASRGYAVLQPQFRGSQGWGQKLWRAGDNEWGQKMQDDNDDGAKWLIDQKIAAPDRIALFGYSYGGYAAMVAAIRPNGLYQCAISGAPGSLAMFKRVTQESRLGREFQRPTVGGLDAIDHAADVKIPLLLYRGDRDSNQAVSDSKELRGFVADLKAAGKPYRYFEIKDMGHTYDTWTPAMAAQQLTEMDAFLGQACKPGGL